MAIVKDPKITLHMYTLRKSTQELEDFENTLQRVADMGYKSVQISPRPFYTTEQLAERLKYYGLSADSAYCDVYQIPEKIDQIAKDAELLGTDVLRTNSIRKEDRMTKEGYESFAAHMEMCGKLLRERGLDFMYHFHAFEWVDFGGIRGMDILMNQTDPNHVMFQPDMFWLTGAGTEPSRSLAMFEGRMRYIHCKDYIIRKPKDEVLEKFTYASAPVGTGNQHWAEITKSALKLGVENFVVEDDIGLLDPFESAQISFTTLTKLIEEAKKEI